MIKKLNCVEFPFQKKNPTPILNEQTYVHTTSLMSLSLVDSVLYRFSFFKEVETTYFWKLDHTCRRHTYVINIYLYIQTQFMRPL